MGPITLFDKSFLQSLSVDESMWFDNYFLTNVSPLFYIETLADLEKSVREGRTPEDEVGIISKKFPEMHGTPCGYHTHQCIGDLLGYSAPMTGQIPVAGGRRVRTGGKRGAVFERSPEAEAFSRWNRGEFLEVERQYARGWRRMLSTLDLTKVSEGIRSLGINAAQCKSLEEAKISGVSMATCKLMGTNFFRAQLDGCQFLGAAGVRPRDRRPGVLPTLRIWFWPHAVRWADDGRFLGRYYCFDCVFRARARQ